jgi:tetratricopeptide (TPR) repeat protein
MWFGSREEEVERLEKQAGGGLERGDWDEAERNGDALLALGWSRGFEFKALAARGRGDDERAVELLEGGVAKVPSAWSLWMLLGIVRSDLGRYASAIEAFQRALDCDGCDGAQVRFNRAIARHRSGDPGGAWDDLEPILALSKPPPFAEDALGLAAECLADLGRAGDALAMIRAAHDACAPHDSRRPRLEAELALALERAGAEKEKVQAAFVRAAQAGVATPALLALGRRLVAATAKAPRRHRIVVDMPAASGGGALRVFDVAADTAEQALELARIYLPVPSREFARIDQHLDRGEARTDEVGVLWASDVAYYEEP